MTVGEEGRLVQERFGLPVIRPRKLPISKLLMHALDGFRRLKALVRRRFGEKRKEQGRVGQREKQIAIFIAPLPEILNAGGERLHQTPVW